MAVKYQSQQQEEKLIECIGKCFNDPLTFVKFNFMWGEGELANETGPDDWQIDVLHKIGVRVQTLDEAVKVAVSSGHGIGKTALIAWIIIWFISTRAHANIVVTANTKTQLETKTWRELAKWHKLSLNKHWFNWTATKFYHIDHPETWFAANIPWSKDRSEAFAGTHGQHVMVMYDEASNIDDVIWEVTEGAMTTPGAIWLAFGNPTRNTGRFKECFGKFSHRWLTYQVDSRLAKKTNKAQLQQWIEDYGIDSDFVRVRVKGQFPRQAVEQFIPVHVVDEAINRNYRVRHDIWDWAPIVIGVDVARFGDDKSIIYVRQGFQTHHVSKYTETNTMSLAGYVAEHINSYKPKSVFVDVVGVGAGVVDRLRHLGHLNIFEVNAGETPINISNYANKRAEMYADMKKWLVDGGSIQNDQELKDQLIAIEYSFDNKSKLFIEKKKDMKARGLPSPDVADALALTFAMPMRVADKVVLSEIDRRIERLERRTHRDNTVEGLMVEKALSDHLWGITAPDAEYGYAVYDKKYSESDILYETV